MQTIRFFFLAIICFMACVTTAKARELPPQTRQGEITLSLEEAILLAVRSNPNVQSSQLSYVAQKFNLYIQQWMFYPHYDLVASASFLQKTVPGQPVMGSQSYNVQPSVSLLTPIGTQVTLTSTNQKTLHFNPSLSLQVMQPLLRGFGRPVVEAALNNACDNEVVARLNVEGVLRHTISTVIIAYLQVVSAERTIAIDEAALARAMQSVKQTQWFIKAGHKAGNELITVKANVARARTQLENDKNSLIEARYALLAAIGVNPTSPIHFTSLKLDTLIHKYQLPTLDAVKQSVLENDIQYQVDNITLHGATKRNVILAEDNQRWKLNFTADVITGNGQGGGQNAGLNSIFTLRNQAQAVGIALQIPINDQQAKQAVMNAKIALKQAELAFQQEKWSKETNAINGWNLVGSAVRALHYAKDAENLQRETYQISYQKYLHGLIDSLELQTAQIQLIEAEQTWLSAEINYIRALVNLDLLTGNTLNTWHVTVRL